jgi:hypothetical protein
MRGSVLVFVLILLAWTSTAFAKAVRPSQIVGNPTTYNGKHLTVSGTVQNVTAKSSRRGNEYETFDLCDNSCLKVFAWGHPELREGQQSCVSGTFDAVKHIGRYTFYNELDAEDRVASIAGRYVPMKGLFRATLIVLAMVFALFRLGHVPIAHADPDDAAQAASDAADSADDAARAAQDASDEASEAADEAAQGHRDDAEGAANEAAGDADTASQAAQDAADQAQDAADSESE